MFDRLEIMGMAKELARHAAARQKVVAANVANADTPGYRAADLESFSDTYRSLETGIEMRRTRPAHLSAIESGVTSRRIIDERAEPSPSGNTVSLEAELVRSSSVKREHDISLAVYKSSLDLLRATLGRGR